MNSCCSRKERRGALIFTAQKEAKSKRKGTTQKKTTQRITTPHLKNTRNFSSLAPLRAHIKKKKPSTLYLERGSNCAYLLQFEKKREEGIV